MENIISRFINNNNNNNNNNNTEPPISPSRTGITYDEDLFSQHNSQTHNRYRSPYSSDSSSDYEVEVSSVFTPSEINQYDSDDNFINELHRDLNQTSDYLSDDDPFLYPSTQAYHPTFAPVIIFNATTSLFSFIYNKINNFFSNSIKSVFAGAMLLKIGINIFIHVLLYPRYNNYNLIIFPFNIQSMFGNEIDNDLPSNNFHTHTNTNTNTHDFENIPPFAEFTHLISIQSNMEPTIQFNNNTLPNNQLQQENNPETNDEPPIYPPSPISPMSPRSPRSPTSPTSSEIIQRPQRYQNIQNIRRLRRYQSQQRSHHSHQYRQIQRYRQPPLPIQNRNRFPTIQSSQSNHVPETTYPRYLLTNNSHNQPNTPNTPIQEIESTTNPLINNNNFVTNHNPFTQRNQNHNNTHDHSYTRNNRFSDRNIGVISTIGMIGVAGAALSAAGISRFTSNLNRSHNNNALHNRHQARQRVTPKKCDICGLFTHNVRQCNHPAIKKIFQEGIYCYSTNYFIQSTSSTSNSENNTNTNNRPHTRLFTTLHKKYTNKPLPIVKSISNHSNPAHIWLYNLSINMAKTLFLRYLDPSTIDHSIQTIKQWMQKSNQYNNKNKGYNKFPQPQIVTHSNSKKNVLYATNKLFHYLATSPNHISDLNLDIENNVHQYTSFTIVPLRIAHKQINTQLFNNTKILHIPITINKHITEHIHNENKQTRQESTLSYTPCTICLESINQNECIVTNCSHIFCTDCIALHIVNRPSTLFNKHNCAMCRQEIKQLFIHPYLPTDKLTLLQSAIIFGTNDKLQKNNDGTTVINDVISNAIDNSIQLNYNFIQIYNDNDNDNNIINNTNTIVDDDNNNDNDDDESDDDLDFQMNLDIQERNLRQTLERNNNIFTTNDIPQLDFLDREYPDEILQNISHNNQHESDNDSDNNNSDSDNNDFDNEL